MATQPKPKKPQSPPPAPAKLKPLPFAFPFLRKGRGESKASAQFTDEHEIYRLLAEREPSGAYLVSRKGMWHGGIHVTEAGAGQSLDLDAGLRCIADGTLIAFRANKTYPVSELGEAGSETLVQAPYSTGFALVQHTMEFPRDTKLTLYSLYMHLMSWEDYANFPKRSKPSYWPRQWQVTQYAQDQPLPGRNGQVPDASQLGLRIRKTPNGVPVGVLPQGAKVDIGKIEMKHGKPWGQLTDIHGALPYPQEAGGYVEPSSVIGKWVYLGQENGGSVAEEVVEDPMFDRVVVVTDQVNPSNPPGIPIKAGDLIGHLGRYDSLNERTSGTRMAHIEVFCDDGIQLFLEQGRAWINQHGPQKEDWTALGLPSEPTILRIAPGTVLYQRTQDDKFVPGDDPQSRKTDAVQVYSLAELARDSNRRVPEKHPNPNPGYPVNWWHVEGVNALGQPIDGWVCDFNFSGGRVTREFAQKWIDFECLADTHDPAHTIFATTRKWADYASGANVGDLASRSNISPLMLKVYDALFKKGDGQQAADELCTLSQTERGGYPWLMQAASRLIVKHESEWANPSKWKQLTAELEKQTGPEPQHEEERKRIDTLAWWDEVMAEVSDFPGPHVHHISPIALVANFAGKNLVCKRCGAIITLTSEFLRKIAPRAGADFVAEMIHASVDLFPQYGVNTCRQMKHLLAQAKHETQRFTEFRESLNYASYTGQSLYNMATKAIDNGFARKNMIFPTSAAKIAWIQDHLVANDAAYGEHSFGASEQPGKDFRGRGLLHLTHYGTYKRCAQAIGHPIDSQPELVENDPKVIIETGLWFWSDRGIGLIADNPTTLGDEGVKKVTHPINPGHKGLSERQQFKREISIIFNQDFSSGCTDD
ncbi:glycoside hydrolase family 19 protein [Burkholderia metallica]|uniref:glycoside hydrolase family 19 protein n=1 Tax=Burkholderia metallica TaxID=488729 RepID=UPI0015755CC2|nr:glycoside hydrolase family 19 protein [Burkholderia metallica]NTZ04623.1 glycoside hydrolase family 19 protein [Burkholderia metallica]NTZ83502.1 glycoside hydrolase family 19 protein [Burkholderia metallica]